MEYIAITGRQPALSRAELERVFGNAVAFSRDSCLVQASSVDVQKLGGTLKAGLVIVRLKSASWEDASKHLIEYCQKTWEGRTGKQTLGMSVYDWDVPTKKIAGTGLTLKKHLKAQGLSLRLIPNQQAALSTATSHHNKLGLKPNKTEILIIRGDSGEIIIAQSTGAQNITALAARDQGRPKRDAFVGMLPPKLALVMVNMAVGAQEVPATSASEISAQAQEPRLLDPFCGTGVILQEASLLGYHVYGTDLSEKMIRYSRDNLNWLQDTHRIHTDWYLHQGDAMTTTWQQPITAVACEAYLGQPFSAPPSPAKLTEVRGNCNHIIGTFLTNLSKQLSSGTPVCIAVPAWRGHDGRFTHLPLVKNLSQFGFEHIPLRSAIQNNLLYYREGQVVARQLLLLVKR